MSSNTLTEEENELVRRCLNAAVDGPFFPDWEFETLIGATRAEVREIAARWPSIDQWEADAVASVVGNLLGYPHGAQKALHSFVHVSLDELSRLFQRLRRDE